MWPRVLFMVSVVVSLAVILQYDWPWCRRGPSLLAPSLPGCPKAPRGEDDDASDVSTGCRRFGCGEHEPSPAAVRRLGEPWWKTHPQPTAGTKDQQHQHQHQHQHQQQQQGEAGPPKAQRTKAKGLAGAGGSGTPNGGGVSSGGGSGSGSGGGGGGGGGANDGFFKGSSGVKHGAAAWDFLQRSPGVQWPTSWGWAAAARATGQRAGNDSAAPLPPPPHEHSTEALCGPFVAWLRQRYLPRAAGRRPVLCSMPPHQVSTRTRTSQSPWGN